MNTHVPDDIPCFLSLGFGQHSFYFRHNDPWHLCSGDENTNSFWGISGPIHTSRLELICQVSLELSLGQCLHRNAHLHVPMFANTSNQGPFILLCMYFLFATITHFISIEYITNMYTLYLWKNNNNNCKNVYSAKSINSNVPWRYRVKFKHKLPNMSINRRKNKVNK